MADEHNILRGMMKTGAGTLASRILGLVREAMTSRFFGAGVTMDMFFMAFQIPNLFRSLFGEGALNASFLPVFMKEGESGGDPKRLLSVVMTALAALLTAITFLGWLICGAVLLSGWLDPKWSLFCVLLIILLPYLPLICLTALQGAALNVRGHFARPAFAPTIMNICWIVAILLLYFAGITDPDAGVKWLAVGVLISGFLQFAFQASMLRRTGLTFKVIWDLANPGLRQIVKLILPIVPAVGVIQINTFIDQQFAQFCVPGDGANSALGYGNRLMQFPLGVLGIALATAVFPAFARHESRGEQKEFVKSIAQALRTSFFVSIPCVAAAVALSVPIVRVLYEGGRFTSEATGRTATVFLCFTLGLWAFCGVQVLARAFYARQEVNEPRKVAAMMVGANILLNLILVWPMREAGLALSSSICGAGNFFFLMLFLRRKIGPIGGREIALSAAKSLAAAALGGLAGYAVFEAAGNVLQVDAAKNHLPLIIALTCGLGALCAVFLLATYLLKSPELREFKQSLTRKRVTAV